MLHLRVKAEQLVQVSFPLRRVVFALALRHPHHNRPLRRKPPVSPHRRKERLPASCHAGLQLGQCRQIPAYQLTSDA